MKDINLEFDKNRKNLYYSRNGEIRELDISNLDIPKYKASLHPSERKLATTMLSIGNSNETCSLPFCIEVSRDGGTSKITNEQGQYHEGGIKNSIAESIDNYTYFNIPVCYRGHASLANMKFDKEAHTVAVQFFDSLNPQDMDYKERYDGILPILKDLVVPDGYKFINEPLKQSHDKIHNYDEYKVLNLLHQGGGSSASCQYYSIYTAMLLRDYGSDELIKASEKEYLFKPSDEQLIKQQLMAVTMAAFDPKSVNITKMEINSGSCYAASHLFHLLDPGYVVYLKNQLLELEKPLAKTEHVDRINQSRSNGSRDLH
ncbi:MAG: hypothetical protein K0R98_29 [Rickettsiaceae bacterium]|jgi:hypothetical protein|nr:hypothetical protein [Rickettsiaceae bacterium]